MTRSGQLRHRSHMRRIASWDLWTTPRPMQLYVLLVEAIVLPLVLILPFLASVSSHDIARAVLIAALAVGFEELSGRIARLRTRLATYSHVDMNSVWTFAGAMVLPAALLAPLCLVVIGNAWLRHGRSGGGACLSRSSCRVSVVA